MTTLTITHGETDALRKETREWIAAAEAGEEPPEREPTLNFDSLRALDRVLSEKNLELLTTIAEHEPASMRATAELVDRDFKQVHDNLTELAALGLIRLEEDGRAKRPVVPYDDIDVHLDLEPRDAATA
jgi:predicted transcriptional regulator